MSFFRRPCSFCAAVLIILAAGLSIDFAFVSSASDQQPRRSYCREIFDFLSLTPRTQCPGGLKQIRLNLVNFPQSASGKADSWPMFGGTPQRNMVNLVDKNMPTDWSIEEGKRKNIKWIAQLGTHSYGGPVIAAGKIFVGTNNANPRDPNVKGKTKAVLMAFSEADGKFLWQIAHDIPAEEIFSQVMDLGLLSTPAIDGDLLYYVTPACEVVCASAQDGKIQWTYDMRKELKVVPLHCGNCSPLVVDDRVFVITSNGHSEGEEGKVTSPKAPSFIALGKKKGDLLWQNNLPGSAIFEGQWSNPALANVGGKQQALFPGGDGFMYGLDPESGKMIWKCKCSPKQDDKDKQRPIYPIATPVVVGDKVYLGLGAFPDGPGEPPFSYFLCLDITKTGDVSPVSYDAKAPANKNSALVWAYGGLIEPRPKRGRTKFFESTLSTAAVHDGLVYISEMLGYLHCLDAKTGQEYWQHDCKAGVWGSPYYLDGKVYQACDNGVVVIFEAGKTKKVIGAPELEEPIQGTPVAAGDVLYISTNSKLYAIANQK